MNVMIKYLFLYVFGLLRIGKISDNRNNTC